MRFRLADRPLDWAERAPIVLTPSVLLPASTDEVFAVLADHMGWTSWFGGMRRMRIDGAASGVGALRTVWVGAARVQERFDVWAPGERLRLTVVESNVPGLRAMTEDWQVIDEGDRTQMTLTIAAEPAGLLRLVPGMARAIVERSTRGVAGLASQFPMTE